MKARELNIVQVGNGAYVSFYVDDVQKARALKEDLKDADMEVTMKKWHDKRSHGANAYAWTLIGQIAFKTKQSTTDVYKAAIREIGGNTDKVCVVDRAVDKFCESWSKNGIGWLTEVMDSKLDGCKTVIVYYGSSTYDTEQMSALINILEQDAKALGIDTLEQIELERMLTDYEKQKNKGA